MKLPRGVSAERLIRALERLGYAVIRQKGSHIRLFHQAAPTQFDLGSIARPAQNRNISWDSCRGSTSSVRFNPRHPRIALSTCATCGGASGPFGFAQGRLSARGTNGGGFPPFARKKAKDEAPSLFCCYGSDHFRSARTPSDFSLEFN